MQKVYVLKEQFLAAKCSSLNHSVSLSEAISLITLEAGGPQPVSYTQVERLIFFGL